MDTIRFDIHEEEDDVFGNEIRVSVIINNTDLKDMIHDIEFRAANGDERRRDWYRDIYPRELKAELEEYRTPTVLGCTCGIAECGPLIVLVTEMKKKVIWSGFKHSPNRRYPVDYSELEFEFDKAQYNAEVEKLNCYVAEELERQGDSEDNDFDEWDIAENEESEDCPHDDVYPDAMDLEDDLVAFGLGYKEILGRVEYWMKAMNNFLIKRAVELAEKGVWREYANQMHKEGIIDPDEEVLRNTGDKNINLLWEMMDKIEEVKQKIIFEEPPCDSRCLEIVDKIVIKPQIRL